MAFGGKRIWGNEYMAPKTNINEWLISYQTWNIFNKLQKKKEKYWNLLPSVKLQTTFVQLLNPSVIILALLLSDSRIPLLHVSLFINHKNFSMWPSLDTNAII